MDISYKFLKLDLHTVFTYLELHTFESKFYLGEKKRLCRECLNGVMGPGQKAKKRKLPRIESQCQSCEECVCQRHMVKVCKPCSQKLQFQEPEVAPPPNEVS